MTKVGLMKAIQSFLQENVREFSFETNEQTEKAPAVVLHGLPPKGEKDTPDFPFIIVRLLEGESNDSGSKAQVKLIFGTYSEDFDGIIDLMNLMERVEQALFKKGILEKRYRIENPFKWKVPEEQPAPEWLGEAVSIWSVPQVTEEVQWND
ncbi:hypothetical protein [Tumebacillus permanentifrigoris]|uniref:Uncharacterized protein n=1 Tax=Tumebacillus permanentifrigoris TaxID=378543 RepID=A0A316DDK7_9BACL|nr:hypothetical protein [Tumebacillus permanentifrigoris]PWK16065.1 hypothetical protein C7459_102312 [Tumebacillus permanentifrigoris]